MRTIALGKSGIEVSAVGLGGIQFSKITRREVAKVIDTALGLGINFFETAYSYFDSEEKIGAAIKGKRDGLVLASKSAARDGKTFTRHIDESLRRLRADVIDIYQLHEVDSKEALSKALAPRGAFKAAGKAIRQGKIRSLGISSHTLELARRVVELGIFDSLQYPMNLINTEVTRSGLLGKARKQKVALIAMKPLAGGRISNARLALGYIYRHRGIVPVVGVETTTQVKQLARVAENPPRLTSEDFEEIRRIRRTVGTRFCRECRYCEPCPQGISVHRALAFPVYVKQMGARRLLKDGVPGWLVKAEDCIECRLCESRCPFHLNIVEGIKESLALARRLMAAGSRRGRGPGD